MPAMNFICPTGSEMPIKKCLSSCPNGKRCMFLQARSIRPGLKREGQPKTRKEWRTDGVHYVLDWAIQLNYYRILLEERGFKVERMVIQAMCRDYNLRIARERNIKSPMYLIPINKISDHWIKLYMKTKAERLQRALANSEMPAPCSSRECWHGRKCKDYCAVADKCPYAMGIEY